MDGAGTRQGFGGAVSRGLVVEMALRWRELFLAVVLLPGAAWGEQTAREILKERRDHELWKDGGGCPGAERYLKAFPEGLHADEARECPTERRAEEIVLPDGLTLADWALMAEDRLKAGDHARLLEEAGAHLREYGPIESVEEIREQAVTGLTAELRVTTREDAPGALERIARLEAAAGERPELLYLKGRAHGLLGDHAAAEAAYLQWLRSVPQTHPERRDVLSALALARAARDKTQRFTELLGRPFSAELKTDAAGWTDLHYAALLDLPGVVAALCDAGMDADTRLKSGSPPFGDDLKRALVALGHEEFKDWEADGETPLMIAAVGNARNAAAALIACGADVAAGNTVDGDTSLHYASSRNSLGVAKLLIERGTDVEAKRKHGLTPLHQSAWNNSLAVAKLLVDHGADVDAKDDSGSTPLLFAAWENSLDVAKLLIERGADVHADHNGVLYRAALENSLDVAKLLIDHGADVNAENESGWPQLQGASARNSLDVAKLLIDRGADVNAKAGFDASTAMHAVAEDNSLDVAKLLIERGADLDAKDSKGRTPLDVALEEGHQEMQALLRLHGAATREAEDRARKPGDTFRDCPECPEMVVVPAGSFVMGSPEWEWDDDQVRHEVRIGYRFAVSVTEVTRGEYKRFVLTTGHAAGNFCVYYKAHEWGIGSGLNWRNPGFGQTDSHPVVCVNWNDAKAYVRWLSGLTGEAYRLLSESEWEYVARAGTATSRYWGESASDQCRYANGADKTSGDFGFGRASCNDGHARTAPVGSFVPNKFGLYDVYGNVWEWVEDCWNDSYDGAPSDGSAWESGNCGDRVVRGGSWYDKSMYLHSANRRREWGPFDTGSRDNYVGFRVARTLTP